MTEGEWLTCPDWRDMFEFVRGRVSDRKLRLFAVACSRAAWVLLHEDGRQAVEVAERFADGHATFDQLRAARAIFHSTDPYQPAEVIRGVRYRSNFGGSTADHDALWAAKAAMRQSADWMARASLQSGGQDFTADELGHRVKLEMTVRRHMFHDVLGPVPFRSLDFRSGWRTATTAALAQQIYDSLNFSVMPVLADALEESGCDNADILTHCRSEGPHVRGCWVVDLILGKQ